MFQWPWNRKKKEAPAGRGEVVEPAPPVWEPLEEKNMTPDGPLPFGYKTGWLCIWSEDPPAVIETLGLEQAAPCTWANGLEQAGNGKTVFVSHALDGCVLVAGWIEEALEKLTALAGGFSRMQYFASHRVADYYAWADYRGGELVRAYCWVGDQGEAVWDSGELTPEEIALGGERFPRMGVEFDWDSVEFPDEETVLSIAAAWGVDTTFSTKEYPPELGWLCIRGS